MKIKLILMVLLLSILGTVSLHSASNCKSSFGNFSISVTGDDWAIPGQSKTFTGSHTNPPSMTFNQEYNWAWEDESEDGTKSVTVTFPSDASDGDEVEITATLNAPHVYDGCSATHTVTICDPSGGISTWTKTKDVQGSFDLGIPGAISSKIGWDLSVSGDINYEEYSGECPCPKDGSVKGTKKKLNGASISCTVGKTWKKNWGTVTIGKARILEITASLSADASVTGTVDVSASGEEIDASNCKGVDDSSSGTGSIGASVTATATAKATSCVKVFGIGPCASLAVNGTLKLSASVSVTETDGKYEYEGLTTSTTWSITASVTDSDTQKTEKSTFN